jgi:hypothetical protein
MIQKEFCETDKTRERHVSLPIGKTSLTSSR